MARLQRQLPTRRQLIVEAIRMGSDTSDKLVDLLGIDIHALHSNLTDMAARKQVRRVGTLKEARRGPRRTVWGAL